MIIFAVVLTLSAVVAFVALKPVTVEYGSSEIYSQEEIKRAVECVKDDFRSFRGCKLFSLSYAGDERVQREAERQLRQGSRYEEFMVIHAAFLSPIFGGGAWNAAFMYPWDWILGRNAGGDWAVIGKGVG